MLSIHLCVDDSNLYIGAKRFGQSRKIDVANLVSTTAKEREVKHKFVVGSFSAEHPAAVQYKAAGFQIYQQDRKKGKESGVDDVLMLKIMSIAAKDYGRPQTLVLVTGDGNSNEGRTNFPEVVEQWMVKGGNVELWSWKDCLNSVGRMNTLDTIHHLFFVSRCTRSSDCIMRKDSSCSTWMISWTN